MTKPNVYIPVFQDAWTLGLAVEGQRGYTPLPMIKPMGSFEEARAEAAERNRYTAPDEVSRIIGTTLGPIRECGCYSCKSKEQTPAQHAPRLDTPPSPPQGPQGGATIPRKPTPPQGGSHARIPQPVDIQW